MLIFFTHADAATRALRGAARLENNVMARDAAQASAYQRAGAGERVCAVPCQFAAYAYCHASLRFIFLFFFFTLLLSCAFFICRLQG